MTYKVKTRTEKRTREGRGASISSYVTEERTVHIAELFEDDVVVCSGEGSSERNAFTALDHAMLKQREETRTKQAAQLDALNEVRHWRA